MAEMGAAAEQGGAARTGGPGRMPRVLTPLLLAAGTLPAAGPPHVAFQQRPGRVEITIDGEAAGTYVYADEEIPRPYFAHLRAPGGIQVTRRHPPVPGEDPTDHATYHPGLWMAFGSLGGSDFWRNKARVRHEGFAEGPAGGPGGGSFAVRNAYLARGDPEKIICREVCRFTFLVRPAGFLILWDATFPAGEEALSFGDQEEMGLGVRVATPITVKAGGRILDAAGRRNERGVWGEAADWCDYSGTIDGRVAGVTLMAHPANFRPSWFHARDYGLLVANPFGRRAFHKGPPSEVIIGPGEALRLRYGVLLHAGGPGAERDPKTAYADYLRLAAGRKAR